MYCEKFTPMRICRSWKLLSLVSLACLFVTGCSQGDRPPLGYVQGTVTIDGEPLGGAIIAFMPEKGRPATATTDEKGAYRIQYTDGVAGSKVGSNSIVFYPPPSGGLSHPIPAKYLNISDLKVDVQSGRNTFDFDLESDSAKKPASKAGAPPQDVVD
jgi:hypothetical protein